MKRRAFVKVLPTLPLLSGAAFALDGTAQAGKASGQSTAAGSQQQKVPAIAKKLAETGEPHSDMTAVGLDGTPQQGFKDRSSTSQQEDPKAPFLPSRMSCSSWVSGI